MDKIKIGVFGARRGRNMITYCSKSDKACIVAVCDNWEPALDKVKRRFPEEKIAFYRDFDEFLKHDMDAVVLANYATEHAPYAIRAMRAGKHVFSEVLPAQTMAEAVALIEAVEETGKLYAYGENYCYMPATARMRQLYQDGKLGEAEYAEGEYIHNCEPIWDNITYGDKNHWRNHMHANFYCTHSLGPLIHITGLRPVSVTGFESTMNERHLRVGALGGQFGMEVVTMDNGAIFRSTHGDLYRNSIWFSLYGAKGRAESAREDTEDGDIRTLYFCADSFSGAYEGKPVEKTTEPEGDKVFGHGGSDFYAMEHFVRKIRGDREAEIIDVYEAMDMFLPGHFAYRSVLAGGIPMEIPDLRKKEVRDLWRQDTLCTDPKVAGDSLVPPFSKGMPEIDDSVYEIVRRKWEKRVEQSWKK